MVNAMLLDRAKETLKKVIIQAAKSKQLIDGCSKGRLKE